VSQTDLFEKDECSPKLGYAYVEIRGKRTHIFKTGKIVMRRADNKEDALGTLAKITRLLLPARVCSCGNLMADCFGGCCDDCFESTCQAFLLGGHEPAPGAGENKTTVKEVLEEHSDTLSDAMKSNFKEIETLVEKLKEIAEIKRDGMTLDSGSLRRTLAEHKGTIVRACTDELLNSDKPESIVIALTQYGIARDLARAFEGYLEIGGKTNEEALQEVSLLFFDAYRAFEERDTVSSRKIQERYGGLGRNWDGNFGYTKIAANGFYISRILGKPVSDLSVIDMNEYGR
jgi:hypothetical protein